MTDDEMSRDAKIVNLGMLHLVMVFAASVCAYLSSQPEWFTAAIAVEIWIAVLLLGPLYEAEAVRMRREIEDLNRSALSEKQS